MLRFNESLDAMSSNAAYIKQNEMAAELQQLNTDQIFMQIAGYSEVELLGAQHNIFRHPDMPRGVFRLLWSVIESGRECFAYVKNMAKNGDYYWAYANITVDYDDHYNPIGYFSVRRKPSGQGIETITHIYQEMLRIERQAAARDAPDVSVQWLTDLLKSKGTSYEEFIHSPGH